MAFAGSAFRQVYATQTAEDNFGHGDLEIACQCLFVMKNGVQGQASIDFLRPAAAPSHGDDRVLGGGNRRRSGSHRGKVILIDKDGRRELPVPPPEREPFSDFANSLTGSRCLVTESETFESRPAHVCWQGNPPIQERSLNSQKHYRSRQPASAT
ncbi:MAG: hypothetical protein V8T87_10290 [Victivallales bacterium]